LRERLVPIYLFHRYQVEAACKKIGGIRFGYAVKGDGEEGSSTIPVAEQWDALTAVLDCLSPEALGLSDELLELLTPYEPEFLSAGVTRELFAPVNAEAFELDRAADAASAITLGHLLHPDRLARIDELHQRDPELPSMDAVLERVIEGLVPRRSSDRGRNLALRRVVQQRLVQQLLALSAEPDGDWRVRAAADAALEQIEDRLPENDDPTRWMHRQIALYLEEGEREGAAQPVPAAIPPGSPIGGCGDWMEPPQP
jgi:hypothetical protein